MTEPELALPDDYRKLLEDLKRTVAAARWRTQRTVNTELLTLYWRLGDAVLQRQHAEGWGTRVIDRLATDLRAAFPDMRGLSRRNLVYMRTFAAAYPGLVAQQPVAQLPWGHVTVLLDKLPDPAVRDWYAAAALEHGWTRNVLTHHIATNLHHRIGAAPSNFPAELPAADSELAQQLTRDPYVLDFLDLTQPAAERDLENALVAQLQAFLLELGHGFAFVGRQYHSPGPAQGVSAPGRALALDPRPGQSLHPPAAHPAPGLTASITKTQQPRRSPRYRTPRRPPVLLRSPTIQTQDQQHGQRRLLKRRGASYLIRAIRMTAVRDFLARDLVVTLAGRYHIWPA